MIIEMLVVGQLQTNCYLIGDEKTGYGAIIDPGGHADVILAATDEHKLDVRYVFNTHAHFDHILANAKVMRVLTLRQEKAPELIVHPLAVPMLERDGGANWFGMPSVPSPKPDRLISDGEALALGSLSMQTLHTPGHSPGSICLHFATENALFDGDVLFRQGVGRTDLPGGDWSTLVHSIRDKLFALPNETAVYPGHGMLTTIGQEKKDNPFVRSR
jgi:glyoxylase-like metal-dependent hydrolase (beta-lactamase superfamily II)